MVEDWSKVKEQERSICCEYVNCLLKRRLLRAKAAGPFWNDRDPSWTADAFTDFGRPGK